MLKLSTLPLTDVQGQKGIRILEYVDAATIKVLALDLDIGIRIANRLFRHTVDTNLTWTDLDTGSEEVGTDYYVYACDNAGELVFKISQNSTYPVGFAASNSRKIGLFHNNPDGNILQYSIQDLNNRPKIGFAPGMVKSKARPVWYDIYLASDDGAGGAASVYGAYYLDTINWFDCVDRANKVGKRLLSYDEFMDMAAGTPEEMSIGAEQHTTGGHSINGNRVISDIGAEDCAGILWQWGSDQNYRYDGGGHSHTIQITYKATPTGSQVYKDQTESNFNAATASGVNETVNTNAVDPQPGWGWYNLPGAKGSIYRQGTYGVTKILFGGNWGDGSNCGSRCATLCDYPWNANNYIGLRLSCDGI